MLAPSHSGLTPPRRAHRSRPTRVRDLGHAWQPNFPDGLGSPVAAPRLSLLAPLDLPEVPCPWLSALVAAAALLAAPSVAAASEGAFSPGAPGIGDPYFAKAGNGGYDVQHYDVGVRYATSTGRLDGSTTITSRATQGLSRFNLD